MQILNRTNHNVSVYNKKNKLLIAIYDKDKVSRTKFTKNVVKIDTKGFNTTVHSVDYTYPTNLPMETSSDTFYIVSEMIALATQANGRDTSDLLIPCSFLQTTRGDVKGCTAFRQI